MIGIQGHQKLKISQRYSRLKYLLPFFYLIFSLTSWFELAAQQEIFLLSIFHFHYCKKMKYAFYGGQAWHPPYNATLMSFWHLKAEVQSFLLMYCLFLQQLWFFQNIENGLRKYFGFLTNLSNENELSSSILCFSDL